MVVMSTVITSYNIPFSYSLDHTGMITVNFFAVHKLKLITSNHKAILTTDSLLYRRISLRQKNIQKSHFVGSLE